SPSGACDPSAGGGRASGGHRASASACETRGCACGACCAADRCASRRAPFPLRVVRYCEGGVIATWAPGVKIVLQQHLGTVSRVRRAKNRRGSADRLRYFAEAVRKLAPQAGGRRALSTAHQFRDGIRTLWKRACERSADRARRPGPREFVFV